MMEVAQVAGLSLDEKKWALSNGRLEIYGHLSKQETTPTGVHAIGCTSTVTLVQLLQIFKHPKWMLMTFFWVFLFYFLLSRTNIFGFLFYIKVEIAMSHLCL